MSAEKITIKEPCSVDWNKMQPDERGKFCAVCSTVVVDFSGMALEDITSFLQKNNKEKICGRYHDRHVSAHSNNKWYQFLNSVEFKFSGTVFKRFVMTLIGFSLILTSCRMRRTHGCAAYYTKKDVKKKEAVSSKKEI